MFNSLTHMAGVKILCVVVKPSGWNYAQMKYFT